MYLSFILEEELKNYSQVLNYLKNIEERIDDLSTKETDIHSLYLLKKLKEIVNLKKAEIYSFIN